MHTNELQSNTGKPMPVLWVARLLHLVHMVQKKVRNIGLMLFGTTRLPVMIGVARMLGSQAERL